MRRRFISILLVLALCLAYVPVKSFAEPLVYSITSNADLSDAIDDIGILAAEAYTLNITADGLSYANAIDFEDKVVTINLNGNTLTFAQLAAGGKLTINGDNTATNGVTETGTLNVGPFIWTCNTGSTIALTNSTLNITDATRFNESRANLTLTLDNNSQILIDPTKDFVTDDDINAATMQTFLMDYLPDHVSVEKAGTNLSFKNILPTGAALDPAQVILRSSFAKADASGVTGQQLPYNGGEQILFTGDSIDGTVYYSEDGGTTWTTEIPREADITEPLLSIMYMVAGDKEHHDSNVFTAQVGITKADAIIVTVDTNIETDDPSTVPDITAVGYAISGEIDPADIAYPYEPVVELAYYDKNGAEMTIKPQDPGTYTIGFKTLTFSNPNYNGATGVEGKVKILTTDGTLAEWVGGDVPAAIVNLKYTGTDQALVTPGTPSNGTAVYSTTGNTGPWSTDIPTAKEVGDHQVWTKIAGDDTHADSDVTGPLGGYIDVADGVQVKAINSSITKGTTILSSHLCTVSSGTLLGGDQIEVENVEWEGLGGGTPDVNTPGEYPFTLVMVKIADPGSSANYAYVEVDNTARQGTLTIREGGGGGGGGGGGAAEEVPEESPSYDFTKTDEGIGSYSEDPEDWTWGERAELSKDVADFYKVLVENSVPDEYAPTVVGDKLTVSDPNGILSSSYTELPGGPSGHTISSFLAEDDTWTLPAEDPDIPPTPVDEVLVCQDNEPVYLDNGDGKVDQSTFGNSNFYTVGVGTGDTKIDYPNLKTGDVVSNTSFNGVYITQLQKSNNPTFDADLAKLKSDCIASFRAFELDHPEVFWLNGSIKLRVLTVTINGQQTSFLFMTLVDDKGFTMRIAEYAAAGAIEAGIKQRDAAVNAIIAQIPAGASTRDKIANLNKWFTTNNEYNRTPDLSTIGYTPHRALKSLTGNEGVNGPVCDGYSRGFKVVCDRLGIPVLLDTGVASIGSHSELHMWMRVKVDGTWYGMDCTWNDPIVKGLNGKVSGYENEKYMLVGDDTVVDGQKFGISHPRNATPGGTTGVLFAALVMNAEAITGYTPIDFIDVRMTDWFYDYVQKAVDKGLMGGTAEGIFSPLGTATRGQIVQILYNAAGQPNVDEVKVDGWFGKAATWAMDLGIVAGYTDGKFHGDDTVTREQLATILWAYAGAPEMSGELDFADSDKVSAYAVTPLLWAKYRGIMGGKPGNLIDPKGTATRAEIATIFSNFIR